MHKPLVGIALFYIAGIFVGYCLGITFLHLHYLYFPLMLLFLTAAFSFIKGKFSLSNTLIHICLLLLGTIAYLMKANPPAPNHISNLFQDPLEINFLTGQGEEVERIKLEGTIVKSPEVRGTPREKEKSGNEDERASKERTVLTLKAERVKMPPLTLPSPQPSPARGEGPKGEWQRAVGLVQVSVYGESDGYEYGDRVRVKGTLRKPPSPQNPGQFDYSSYLARKGIYGLMTIYNKGQIERLGTGKVNPFVRLALGIKHRMRGIIAETLEYPQDVLLAGILIGERQQVPEELKEVFIHSGTVHILAISGLHVGLVVVIFMVLLRTVRIPRKIRAILTIALVILYALITGARPSVIRASIMATCILSAAAIGRDSDLLNSLSLAALLILAVNPLELFDSGFQLSFAAVLSIIYLTPKINSLFPKGYPPVSALKGYLLSSTSVILAAQLGILPLIAYYYSLLSPVALVANFIVVPLLGVVVALGFTSCLSGLLFLPLAQVFGAANSVVLKVVVISVKLLSSLPLAFIYPGSPRIGLIVIYYLALGAIFYAIKKKLTVEGEARDYHSL